MQVLSVLRLKFTSQRVGDRGEARALIDPRTKLDFVAYGDDCVVTGVAEVPIEPRLTDMLNRHDAYELVSVTVEPHDSGIPFGVGRVELARTELLAVAAHGPRGDARRRTRTRAHGIAAELGPYLVRGYLHALPGADPVLSVRRRPGMVPLTDASIEYRVGNELRIDRSSVLIINRERMSWLTSATILDTAPRMPELPVAKSNHPMVKDFTGELTAAAD